MEQSDRTSPLEFYQRFAPYYDAICGDAVIRARQYLTNALPNIGGSGRTALDLGCGTGDTAALLSDAGWRVIGYDVSDAMLSHARLRRPHCRFECVDLRNLPVGTSAELAVCFGDTLNHLINDHDWPLLFRRVAQNLMPGGIFLFDVLTPFDHEEVWPQSLEVAELAECVLVVRGGYNSIERRAKLNHIWFFRTSVSPDHWQRFDHELLQVSFSEGRIRKWLGETGFCDVVFTDGDTCGQLSPTSTRWFVRSHRL